LSNVKCTTFTSEEGKNTIELHKEDGESSEFLCALLPPSDLMNEWAKAIETSIGVTKGGKYGIFFL
jgi:hypothetical protein